MYQSKITVGCIVVLALFTCSLSSQVTGVIETGIGHHSNVFHAPSGMLNDEGAVIGVDSLVQGGAFVLFHSELNLKVGNRKRALYIEGSLSGYKFPLNPTLKREHAVVEMMLKNRLGKRENLYLKVYHKTVSRQGTDISEDLVGIPLSSVKMGTELKLSMRRAKSLRIFVVAHRFQKSFEDHNPLSFIYSSTGTVLKVRKSFVDKHSALTSQIKFDASYDRRDYTKGHRDETTNQLVHPDRWKRNTWKAKINLVLPLHRSFDLDFKAGFKSQDETRQNGIRYTEIKYSQGILLRLQQCTIDLSAGLSFRQFYRPGSSQDSDSGRTYIYLTGTSTIKYKINASLTCGLYIRYDQRRSSINDIGSLAFRSYTDSYCTITLHKKF